MNNYLVLAFIHVTITAGSSHAVIMVYLDKQGVTATIELSTTKNQADYPTCPVILNQLLSLFLATELVVEKEL